MVFIDKLGQRLALYRKTHLWDPFRVFERVVFEDGPMAPPLVSFLGVQIGLLVCWDVEYPENCRALALRGAQLVLAIAANADAFVLSHIVRVRAFENLLHVAYCNAAGVPFCGASTVCGPTGEVLLALPAEREAVGHVTLDLGHPQWEGVRTRNPFFHHRRPELYAGLAASLEADLQRSRGTGLG